jgi:hypothetical protein
MASFATQGPRRSHCRVALPGVLEKTQERQRRGAQGRRRVGAREVSPTGKQGLAFLRAAGSRVEAHPLLAGFEPRELISIRSHREVVPGRLALHVLLERPDFAKVRPGEQRPRPCPTHRRSAGHEQVPPTWQVAPTVVQSEQVPPPICAVSCVPLDKSLAFSLVARIF